MYAKLFTSATKIKPTAQITSPSSRIIVLPLPARGHAGRLRISTIEMPCVLGRSGTVTIKREGDGGTPAGRMRLVSLCVRRDRLPGPACAVPSRPTGRRDGWCDDPRDGRYNRPVRLPVSASAEALWRQDRIYDVVGILDWNLRPRVRGRGSAIFLHLCRPGLEATEGCIALRRADLLRLLAICGSRPVFDVAPSPRRICRQTPVKA
jgi:L,D-peptidoglycan transpeptidase YkuD (ErfK/YbiS/YcfS/YnhG family)